MRRCRTVAAVTLFGLLISVLGSAPSAAAPGAAASPGRYIVVLTDDAPDPAAVADQHRRSQGAQVSHVYRAALKGYAAVIPNDRVAAIRADARVSYVEPDEVVQASAQVIPYGITKVGADVSSVLAGNGSGAVTTVNAYVVDTGIDTAHPDLSVVGHVNFANGKNLDCNGHGTHVAGTVAARDNAADVVGVSPGMKLTGVKVLACNGSGRTSGVIAGVDWVTQNAVKPAVANMSLGGGTSRSLDQAVAGSAASGVVYAVAAGNEDKPACNYSPARAGAGTSNGILTVAAIDASDNEAAFSNYGTCVDLWAPGVSVLSTRNGGGTTTLSGTSMASPHVAGGAAVYLSTHPTATPSEVETALKAAVRVVSTKSEDGASIRPEYIGTF